MESRFSEEEKGTDTSETAYTKGLQTGKFAVKNAPNSNKQHFLDCYQYRENLPNFLMKLREKAVDGNVWTTVTTVGWNTKLPGLLIRHGDISPAQRDRQRIIALIDAWSAPDGPLQPQYLDLPRIVFCRQLYERDLKTIDDAYNIIIKSAFQGVDRGALADLSEVLTDTRKFWAQQEEVFFGKALYEGWGINEFMSLLLDWDDRHCFGLIYKINRESFSGAYPFTYQAAAKWIDEQKTENTVYSRYSITE